jgi:hypothetical protein
VWIPIAGTVCPADLPHHFFQTDKPAENMKDTAEPMRAHPFSKFEIIVLTDKDRP